MRLAVAMSRKPNMNRMEHNPMVLECWKQQQVLQNPYKLNWRNTSII